MLIVLRTIYGIMRRKEGLIMIQRKKALCAASASALAVLGGLYGLYRYAFYSPRGAQNDDHHISTNPQMRSTGKRYPGAIDALNALPCERVYITSADGLRLTGRYYPAKPGAPLVIACHGYRGTPSRDFSVGAEIYRSMGCALLLIEERGQCGSAGHTITFGAMEKYDVLLWTRWAADRFGGIPILLGGISMGAATVLMASALGPAGKRPRCDRRLPVYEREGYHLLCRARFGRSHGAAVSLRAPEREASSAVPISHRRTRSPP